MSGSRNYLIVVGSEPTDDPRPRYRWSLSTSDGGPCVSEAGHAIRTLSATTYATPGEAVRAGEFTNRHYNDEIIAARLAEDARTREARG